MSQPYAGAQSNGRTIDTDRGAVALTDHSLTRWAERAPHDRQISAHEAFRKGGWINHPNIIRRPQHTDGVDMVRVFKKRRSDGSTWGVAWIVCDGTHEPDQDHVAVTTITFGMVDHGPSRAYLDGRPAHDTPPGEP